MPTYLFSLAFVTASGEPAKFIGQLGDHPLLTTLLVIVGVLFGLILGSIYSSLKNRLSISRADRKLKNIVANFEQEKGASETILRELQVGIIAYGGDGRLISENPSAHAILDSENLPLTLQEFLVQYGNDNGIQAAFLLQTPNITGIANVKDRIVRLRLTQSQLAQLGAYRKPSWIIIIQDITEQEREEKQRKDFVANVSHELKTPLTTISGYSETLLDWGLEGMSAEEIKTYIHRIHDDAVRMDSLVQDLLLLSSIDSRGIRPRMGQYDIVSVMKQVVSRMQVQAVEKEIQLESSVLSIIQPVFGDASAIDRILTNLVSNGIKYTDLHGFVSVSIQLTNDYISLKVTDNGMGVAKDNLPRLFNRFYRVDSTGSRKYGGTGLGLSIAKELTEIQGGTISVASVIGKGTEFVVTIPKAEKTYREALTAVFDGSPRTEILYENACTYLQSAAEEIDLPIQSLGDLQSEEMEDLLSYLLTSPEESDPEYAIVSPAETLQARYEAERRTRAETTKRTRTVPPKETGASSEKSVSEEKIPAERRASKKSPASDVIRSSAEKTGPFEGKRATERSMDLPRSAVRRAAMESTGELPKSKSREDHALGTEKPERTNMTIEQLQKEVLRGKHNV